MAGKNPKNIYSLGVASFFTDISSEMVFSILPIFLSSIIGVGKEIIGLIEGVADSLSSILDIFVGYLSDSQANRKKFVLLGYSLSSFSKLGIALSSSWPAILLFRATERLGKSIRTSPRDALIAASSSKRELAKSFGVHRAMDTAGALVGPAIAYGLLSYLGSSQESFQAIFYISAIPAFFAVFVIWKFVKEPPARERVQKRVGFWQRLRFLPPFFKRFLAISCFFSLSYFSFAFLIVKASESGLLPQDVLLLYMLFNFSYMLFAVPAGRLADKIGRKKTIAASFFLYALVLLGFAFFSDFWHLAMLFLLYGLFVAADESVNKAYILELVGKRSAGMALGAYSSAVGAVYLPASVLFGAIWSSFGAFVAFLLAALVAASSSIAMHFFSAKSNQTKLFIN